MKSRGFHVCNFHSPACSARLVMPLSDTAANTTILAGDRELLLLRGQAEAMRELAMRGVAKPVQLRDGLGMGPRNAHPAALYDALLCEFRERAAA